MIYILVFLFLTISSSADEKIDIKPTTKDAPKKDKSAIGDFLMTLLGGGKYNHGGGYGQIDEHYENDGYTGYGGYQGLSNTGYGSNSYGPNYGSHGYFGYGHGASYGSHGGGYGPGKGYGRRPPIGIVVLLPEELLGDYGGYRGLGDYGGGGGGGGYRKIGNGKKIG